MSTHIIESSNILNIIVQALIITGAVNWGLIGLIDIDLVKWLFGETAFSRTIYVAVGVAGIVRLAQLIVTAQHHF